jgi:hypothetical protein
MSQESLANEGFETFGEFRRGWAIRERRRFPLTAPVTVHLVRPWTPDDGVAMGNAPLRKLYDELLEDGASEPVALRVAA